MTNWTHIVGYACLAAVAIWGWAAVIFYLADKYDDDRIFMWGLVGTALVVGVCLLAWGCGGTAPSWYQRLIGTPRPCCCSAADLATPTPTQMPCCPYAEATP